MTAVPMDDVGGVVVFLLSVLPWKEIEMLLVEVNPQTEVSRKNSRNHIVAISSPHRPVTVAEHQSDLTFYIGIVLPSPFREVESDESFNAGVLRSI